MLVFFRAIALASIVLWAGSGQAQNYPDHPVKIIVPYPAGGGTDVYARFLAQQLSQKGTQRFIVENVAGANGGIGTAAAATAKADGYTLLIASPGTLLVNPRIYKGIHYRLSSFEPVIALSNFTNLVVVSAKLGVGNANALVALAKKQPGKLNFGSSGHGNLGHFAGEMFKANTGIDIVHVPYKGGNEAMMGLLGGSIDILFPSVNEAQTYVTSGAIKPVGVMSERRTPLMPDVPTLREQGILNTELASWNGIVAPAGTPPAIVMWLNDALNEILLSPAGAETMQRFGTVRIGGSVADFKKRLETENEVWTKLIDIAGIERSE